MNDTPAESAPGGSFSALTGFLLGAVGLLVALLGALATSNGGAGRIELNERTWLLSGTVAVLVAIVFEPPLDFVGDLPGVVPGW